MEKKAVRPRHPTDPPLFMEKLLRALANPATQDVMRWISPDEFVIEDRWLLEERKIQSRLSLSWPSLVRQLSNNGFSRHTDKKRGRIFFTRKPAPTLPAPPTDREQVRQLEQQTQSCREDFQSVQMRASYIYQLFRMLFPTVNLSDNPYVFRFSGTDLFDTGMEENVADPRPDIGVLLDQCK